MSKVDYQNKVLPRHVR